MNGSDTCSTCHDFEADPMAIEASLAGFAVLSSGLAATRAGDGHCRRHDRFLRATASCAAFNRARVREHDVPPEAAVDPEPACPSG